MTSFVIYKNKYGKKKIKQNPNNLYFCTTDSKVYIGDIRLCKEAKEIKRMDKNKWQSAIRRRK